jgi:hypothetical protein
LSAVWICATTGPLSPYLRFCIEDELTTECYTITGWQILHLWAIFGSGSGFRVSSSLQTQRVFAKPGTWNPLNLPSPGLCKRNPRNFK